MLPPNLLILLLLPNIDRCTREQINCRHNIDRKIQNARPVTSGWCEQIDRFFHHATRHSSCGRTRQGASRPTRNTRSINDCVCTHARTPRLSRSDRYRFAFINFSYCRARKREAHHQSRRVRMRKKNTTTKQCERFPRDFRYVKLGFYFVKILIKKI